MEVSRILRTPHRYAMFHAYFLVLFLVLFPKGGIKIANIPLTWGYLYLALSFPLLAIVRLLAVPLRVRGTTLTILGLLVPMQILLVYAFLVYGYINAGYSISMMSGFCFLPLLFLGIYPPFFRLIHPERLSKWFRFCMLAAALWGIFLFVLHPFTGHYIEIPFLTVNAGDYGLLEGTKHNARGFFQKLISTYNNGNLYGVATLILLPLYNTLEPRRWKRGVLITAALLTLSRTVWVGLLLLQAAPLGLQLLRQLRTFPVVYLGAAARRTLSVLLIIGLIFGALFLATNSGIAFLLDPTLGGRSAELRVSSAVTLLPAGPLVGFDESLYGSALRYYGLSGLFFFSLLMASPVLVMAADPAARRSPERMAAFSGLMVYAIVAASDGAFVLIPVTVFYWFTYAVLLHGWPGGSVPRRTALSVRQRAGSRNPKLILKPLR